MKTKRNDSGNDTEKDFWHTMRITHTHTTFSVISGSLSRSLALSFALIRFVYNLSGSTATIHPSIHLTIHSVVKTTQKLFSYVASHCCCFVLIARRSVCERARAPIDECSECVYESLCHMYFRVRWVGMSMSVPLALWLRASCVWLHAKYIYTLTSNTRSESCWFPLLWTFRCRVASRALWMCNIRQTEMKVVLYFVPVPVFIKTTYYWRQRRRLRRPLYVFRHPCLIVGAHSHSQYGTARHDSVPSIRNNKKHDLLLTHGERYLLSRQSAAICVALCVQKPNWLTLIWLLVHKWSC